MDAQISDPSDGEVSWAVDTLKMLADPTRLRIVWALLHGEHSVGRLAEHVDAQPAAVSQHLAKLRLARLVGTRRDGTHVYYQIENDHIRRLVTEALFNADHALGDAEPAHHAPGRAPAAEPVGPEIPERQPAGPSDGPRPGSLVAGRRGSSVK